MNESVLIVLFTLVGGAVVVTAPGFWFDHRQNSDRSRVKKKD